MADDTPDLKRIVKVARDFSRPYRIDDGRRFRLKDYPAGDTAHLDDEDKPRAQEALEIGRNALAELQDMLYAQDKWAVLLVFQAMDAAGKDGAIKHVMSGVNPQGCQVFSFKAPTSEELDHDYLWRCMKNLPERGRIGIFNRSYYEEVLVVKVHPEFLRGQKLPPQVVGKNLWKERYQDIRAFERYLSRNGVLIRKFFLNVSRAEQKKRFLERIDEPGEELEILRGGREGARALERVHGRVRDDDPRDVHARVPVVRGARRQQVVHADRRGQRDRRRARVARTALSQGRAGRAQGTCRGEEGAAGREAVSGRAPLRSHARAAVPRGVRERMEPASLVRAQSARRRRPRRAGQAVHPPVPAEGDQTREAADLLPLHPARIAIEFEAVGEEFGVEAGHRDLHRSGALLTPWQHDN